MRNSDLIDHIFSEALNQLRQDWSGDPAVAGENVSPPQPPAPADNPEAVARPAPEEIQEAEGPDEPAAALPVQQENGDECKENMVALNPKKNDENIPDLPPEISSAAGSEEDDLDSLLEDLANSADPDKTGDADFSNLFSDEKGEGHFDGLNEDDAGLDATGHSLDDLLEHALGLDDTPDEEEEESDLSATGDIPGFESDEEEDEDTADEVQPGEMIEPSFDPQAVEEGAEAESDLDALLGSASDLVGDDGEAEPALSDDLFRSDDESSGEGGLDSLLGEENAGEEEDDIVETVKVPEPSIPLSEETDEELERQLAEMGLGGDNLLHNRFSAGKEKLLHHLLARFEALARQKLEPLPNDQANLVRSVNLRVEIDLKFGEFTASGNDDSLFQLEF